MTNVAVVMLNHLISSGCQEVEIAGLDGYKPTFDNYNYEETSTIQDIQELMAQNDLISSSLQTLSKTIRINLLTPSIFSKDLYA